MPFLAVMNTTPEGRIAKYQDGFKTRAEAVQHVLKHNGKFAIREPSAPWNHWRIDVAGKKISIDPPSRPAPEPEPDMLLAVRDLADELGPSAVAKLENRMGQRRP